MVPGHIRDWIDHILVFAQCDRVDEEQAVYEPQNFALLYRHDHPSSAILGNRDLRQLRLLQQHKPYCLRKDPPVGSIISVGAVIVVSSFPSVTTSTDQSLAQRSVVDLYNVQPLLGGQDTLQLWHPRVSTRMPSIRAHAGLNVSLYCLHCPRYYQRDWGT